MNPHEEHVIRELMEGVLPKRAARRLVQIEWQRRARSDSRDLKAHIANDLPYYAKRFTYK